MAREKLALRVDAQAEVIEEHKAKRQRLQERISVEAAVPDTFQLVRRVAIDAALVATSIPSSTEQIPDPLLADASSLINQEPFLLKSRPVQRNIAAASRSRSESRPRVKTAQIVNLPCEQKMIPHLIFNGQYYQLKLLGEGNFHKVYSVATGTPLVINGVTIPTGDVVIKTFKGSLSDAQMAKAHASDLAGVDSLRNGGVPMPHIYFSPDQVVDPSNDKNGFWVIQKMRSEVSAADPDAFEFAKLWLMRSIAANKEIINDFYSRNLMRDGSGAIRVVDCGEPERFDVDDAAENDFVMNLAGYLFHWSLGGNSEKLNALMEGYPEKLKSVLYLKIEAKIKSRQVDE